MLKFIKETGYKQVPSGGKRKMALYKCDCGNIKEIHTSNVTRGITKSCGCITIKHIKKLGLRTGKAKASYTHGMFGTRFYGIYHSMVSRTKEDPKNKTTRFYGMRGIKCEWKSFEDFRDDMYENYVKHVKIHSENQTTIDRLNPNGNYCKENCRWATRIEQGANRRNNLLITINGETKHLSEWVRILKICARTVKKRYLV